MYEIKKSGGGIMDLQEFLKLLNHNSNTGISRIGDIRKWVESLSATNDFIDDASLIEFVFNPLEH